MADDSFNIPRPAQAAPGLTGQPPLPVGRPMILKNPSPGERAILEELGWQEGQPVPENLGEIIRQAREDAENLDSLQPPAALNTPKLQLPPEQDIANMPSDEQTRYLEIVKQAMAVAQANYDQEQQILHDQIEAAGPGINEAIRQASLEANTVQVEDDREGDTYATGTPKVTSKPAKPASEPRDELTNCPNCGWNLDNEEVEAISNADVVNFLQSVLGGTPFIKQYQLYDGKLKIALRTLTPEEIDLCFRQRLADIEAKRLASPSDELEMITRYRACLQIVEIVSGDSVIQFPRSLAAWKSQVTTTAEAGDTILPGIWAHFQQHACPSEVHHRAIMSRVLKFNSLIRRLEENAENPDFWKTTG